MIPFHILSAFILLTFLNSGIGQGGLKFLFYSRVYLGENFVKLYVGLISGHSYISHYKTYCGKLDNYDAMTNGSST